MSRVLFSAVATAAVVAVGLACPVRSAFAQSASPSQPSPQAPAAKAAPAAVPSAPAPEPSLEAKERARVAYARGQAAFAQGEYAQAKQAFEEAFASVPNPIVLLGTAEAAAKLGLIDDAVAALDQYLQLRPDAADHADIEQKRSALLLSPARLSVSSEPAAAEILVDGQSTAKRTPAEFDVSPGDHQLQVSLAGYEAEPESIHARAGQRLERRIAMRAATPVPAPVASVPVAPPVAPVANAEVPTAALWVTGGLGAAGLIAGGVLGIFALKEHADFKAKPSEASADRGERLALFSDVGFGVGAMAIVTAAVLLLTHDEPAPAEQARRAKPLADAGWQLIPRVSANSASATARLRF